MRTYHFVLLSWLLASAAPAAQAPLASHAQPGQAGPSKPVPVARVNGVAILSDRLAVAVNRLLPALSFHGNVDPAKQAQLRKQALDGLIDEELENQDALRRKVPVTAAEIEDGLAQLRRRYPSAQAFDRAMRDNGVTRKDLEQEIARTIRVRKVIDLTVTSIADVTEAEAETYYRKNLPKFVMPERVRVFAITISVDPSGTKDDWAKRKKTAEDIRARILAGSSFEAEAKAHSTDPSKSSGGDMGWIHRGGMTPEFERITTAMKPGEVSEVVQTIYGYHVVRVAAIAPPEQRTFPQVKESLVKDLSVKRREESKTTWLEGLRARATIEILESPPARKN